MQSSMEFLATLCCAIFSGAAIYINAVEHPARMSCGIKVALSEWAPSYQRATIMQASLALLGFLFSFLAWWFGSDMTILIAGILLLSVGPFTLIVIMPTNRRLLVLDSEKDADEVEMLLKRWNRLHMVRSVLGTISLVVFLLAA